MSPDLIKKYSAPVPRYTSFPTAPHFHDGVDENTYRSWLSALDPNEPISLYAHIPYCDTLCWFCGCHTKMTKSYNPVEKYLPPLTTEIETVAALLPEGCRVSHIHWGGGSPTILSPDDIQWLAWLFREKFSTDKHTEFAIEIDPRGMSEETISALANAGVNRASLGVQDFDPIVQQAINRIQTYEETAKVVNALRDFGITPINVDVLYGLPYQTIETLEETIKKTLTLNPDRIALFGYAHVPWMKRHQQMIAEDLLPSNVERFEQAKHAADILMKAGYIRVGIDHFARPEDSLALAAKNDKLRRNFQGYTTDASTALIGFGASAISSLPQGYVQNITATAEYERRITKTGLATAKGKALSPDDKLRAHVIERLMCDMKFSRSTIARMFGSRAQKVLQEADELILFHEDALIDANDDGFEITEQGRPFMRAICAHFDPYLKKNIARHSAAV